MKAEEIFNKHNIDCYECAGNFSLVIAAMEEYANLKVKEALSPKEEGKEAKEFAEWIANNEYQRTPQTHTRHKGKWWIVLTCEYFTTEELYQLFKQTK